MCVDCSDAIGRQARIVECATHAELGALPVRRRTVEIECILARAEADDFAEDRRAARLRAAKLLEDKGSAAFREREPAALPIERLARGARHFTFDVERERL